MEILYSSKKPSVKPMAPVASRKSIMPGSHNSLPGQSERAQYVDRQSSLAVGSLSWQSEITYHKGEDELLGNKEGNPLLTRSDNELVSVVARRLCDVEALLASHNQLVQDLQQEIRAKDSKIQALSHKLRNRDKMLEDVKCTKSKGSLITVDKAEYQAVRTRLEQLRKTVEEMHQFFSDYGVTWVGSGAGIQRKTEEKFHVDFKRFLACIDDLNLFVREGESQMVYTNHGAVFKMPESVPLYVFSNGLMLFSGPFRDYSDPLTQEFVNDIMDGFFPSELQRSYPDGVPFKVIDKHDVMYQDPKLRLKVFGGVGQRLGHLSAGDLPPNGEEIVFSNRPTSIKSEVILNSGLQVNVNCHDLKRDVEVNTACANRTTCLKSEVILNSGSQVRVDGHDLKRDTRVGVNSAGVGDLADTAHLSSVLDNKVKEARLKCLSSSENVAQEPPLPIKDTSSLKPVKRTRNRKLLPVVVPNPVKKSTAHTNITQKSLPDAGSVRTVKELSTYENILETFDCCFSNDELYPLNTTMKKLNRARINKCKDIKTERPSKLSSTNMSADSTGKVEEHSENHSNIKTLEQNFPSCSTITPGSLDNRGFTGLPQDMKDRFQRCSKENVNLAQQEVYPLPSIVSDSPKEAVKRCQTNAGPKRIGAEEFLKKLPSVVVRDGKLVDIRGGVASLIQIPKSPGPKYHTIKFDDNQPRIQLKIRSVDGEKIYLVHISPHRTIGDLRIGLNEMTRINGLEPTKYSILNPSNPTRVNGLTNNQSTLQQLGIVHNTVLYLQNLAPTPKVESSAQK